MTDKRRRDSAEPQRPATPSGQTGAPSQHDPSYVPVSPDTVRERLTAPDASAGYACAPGLAHRVAFHASRFSSILVPKGNSDSEFILRGVFMIDRDDFFFTPDGNFNPANPYRSPFHGIKLACRLTAPSAPEFQFAYDDFPACIENLHLIERLVEHDELDEHLSSVSEHHGKTRFKLCHALFDPKPTEVESPGRDDSSVATLESGAEEDAPLGPEFAMETWPVAPHRRPYLEQLFDTHDVSPLPAFDLKGKLIPPTHYETALRGATVEVHFAFVHYFIGEKNRHIYNASLRRLQVLRAPWIPSSPHKRMRVSAAQRDKADSGA